MREQLGEALKYHIVAYDVRKQTLSENQLDIARSSLNLGCDYAKYVDHDKAEKLLMEALHIRELNYSGKEHANIAIVLAASSKNYIN